MSAAANADGDLGGTLRRAAEADLQAIAALLELAARDDIDGAALARSLSGDDAIPEDGPWLGPWWNEHRVGDWMAFAGADERLPGEAAVACDRLGRFLEAILRAARAGSALLHDWDPERGWVWPPEMQ